MGIDKIEFFELEKHHTKDIIDKHVNGSLTVIWRDWDNIIKNPKMVYISSVNPDEKKGPHIHKKRTSYFVCIKGKVIFVVKTPDNRYLEIESSEKKPILVKVPKNTPSAHINLDKNISIILTLADIAWKPNDNEMEDIIFDDYDWKKWNSSLV